MIGSYNQNAISEKEESALGALCNEGYEGNRQDISLWGSFEIPVVVCDFACPYIILNLFRGSTSCSKNLALNPEPSSINPKL